MSQYRRKYLLRLNERAIEHAEFAKAGKRSEAIIKLLGAQGLAECLNIDGEPTSPADLDAIWQITDKGRAAIGKG